jgi:acyl carrier protein
MASTVTKEQIEERLTAALVEFGAEKDQISRDAEFESLDVDSLDLVEMSQIVEEEWGIELKSDDMKDLKTFGQAVDLVADKAAA